MSGQKTKSWTPILTPPVGSSTSYHIPPPAPVAPAPPGPEVCTPLGPAQALNGVGTDTDVLKGVVILPEECDDFGLAPDPGWPTWNEYIPEVQALSTCWTDLLDTTDCDITVSLLL